MPFTALELENISNALLDYHMNQGEVMSQSIQDKPLLKRMKAAQKTFPGGKENITKPVKFDYTTDIMGYSEDDEVTYSNPANIKTASYPWKEVHGGIKVTLTELKKAGISVTDSTTGANTSEHSGREKFVLADLLKDKIEDMTEGYARGMNEMYWRDGTQDSKQVAGVQSFILTDPTSAVVVGGIDQSAQSLWRNRANSNLPSGLLTNGAIDAGTPTNLNIVKAFKQEFRQLRRYGNPKHFILAGSDFIEAMENELLSKGEFTQTGFMRNGPVDMGVADLQFKGVSIEYDPTLDDLGYSKYAYVLDSKAIKPMVMEGEDMKRHSPARPENKYVIYRAVTWTGGLVCWCRNTSGVYWIN